MKAAPDIKRWERDRNRDKTGSEDCSLVPGGNLFWLI